MKKTETAVLVVLTVFLSLGIPAAGADQGSAGQSPGAAIGRTARKVVDGSREIVKETKEAFTRAGKAAAKKSRKAYKEIKQAGRKTAGDIKRGFKGSGQGAAAGKAESKPAPAEKDPKAAAGGDTK